MLRRRLAAAFVALAFCVTPAHTAPGGGGKGNAPIYFDDFSDGTLDGWIFFGAPGWPSGNWRVENGALVQDLGGDHYSAVVDGIEVASQSVETLVSTFGPAGYGGITIWLQDASNWVHVTLYPAAGTISVTEHVAGTPAGGVAYTLPTRFYDYTVYRLRVDADSKTGNLDVYVDGKYFFTHKATTTYRYGFSGVLSGNSGGTSDDFKLMRYSRSRPPK